MAELVSAREGVELKKRNSADSLERFAISIEERLRKSGATSTIENLICRMLTNRKRPDIASRLVEKWVEWRFGKPKETHEHTGPDGGPIEHTIRFGDGNRDS